MEFEGQYLTYEEYKGLGGTLDLTPFSLLEFEVRRKIDIRSQNRLKGVENIPEEVKLCEYKMIESIEKYVNIIEEVGNGNVASENTDGYSVSYITADKVSGIIKDKDEELNNLIREYLLGVVYEGQHILFVGRDRC